MAKGIYNYESTKTTRYDIDVYGKSTRLKKLKIAMAADLHVSENTSRRFMRQFVEKVNGLEPDIVLLAGDIFDARDPRRPRVKFAETQLSTIRSKYGAYAVEGNHDLYKQTYPYGFFERANIQLLRDSVATIDQASTLLEEKTGVTGEGLPWRR